MTLAEQFTNPALRTVARHRTAYAPRGHDSQTIVTNGVWRREEGHGPRGDAAPVLLNLGELRARSESRAKTVRQGHCGDPVAAHGSGAFGPGRD